MRKVKRKGKRGNPGPRYEHKVAQRLRRARKERGLSQERLARLSGLSQTAISAYERGAMEPTVGNLLALARALRVSPQWLMGLGPSEVEVLSPSAPAGPLPAGLEEFLNSPVGRALKVTEEEVLWLLSLCTRWEASPDEWLGRLITLRWLTGKPLSGSEEK